MEVTTARVPAQRRAVDDDDGWRERALIHKVQIRPDVASARWYWCCLTCGTEIRSEAIYIDVAHARVAAELHDERVDVLR